MRRVLAALFLFVMATSTFAENRVTPLTRAIADSLYAKLAGGSSIAGTTTFANLTVSGTCTGCGGAGTVTSVGNGTIGSLFTASWANSTTTPALSFDITNQGTVAQVLHGNAAGHPSFGAVVSADLNVTGTTCSNQFLTVLSSSLAGTCTTATLAGAQFANQGSTTTLLHGAAAGNPSWSSVVSADLNITTTTCTNQFVSAISAGGVGTCTTDTLASAQHANQGTAATVLHGNASGNPAFGAVVDGDLSLTSPSAATSMISPLFRSPTAKVLLQGTGTGASQLALTQTTAPTCSSGCGTSPSIVGTDTAGIVTMGASGVPVSGWVVTFNGTWAAAPACNVWMALTGMSAVKLPLTIVTTTTTITVVLNGTPPANSDKFGYICVGTQ